MQIATCDLHSNQSQIICKSEKRAWNFIAEIKTFPDLTHPKQDYSGILKNSLAGLKSHFIRFISRTLWFLPQIWLNIIRQQVASFFNVECNLIWDGKVLTFSALSPRKLSMECNYGDVWNAAGNLHNHICEQKKTVRGLWWLGDRGYYCYCFISLW